MKERDIKTSDIVYLENIVLDTDEMGEKLVMPPD